MASASETLGRPIWKPPNPRHETLSSVRPSARRGMSPDSGFRITVFCHRTPRGAYPAVGSKEVLNDIVTSMPLDHPVGSVLRRALLAAAVGLGSLYAQNEIQPVN